MVPVKVITKFSKPFLSPKLQLLKEEISTCRRRLRVGRDLTNHAKYIRALMDYSQENNIERDKSSEQLHQ